MPNEHCCIELGRGLLLFLHRGRRSRSFRNIPESRRPDLYQVVLPEIVNGRRMDDVSGLERIENVEAFYYVPEGSVPTVQRAPLVGVAVAILRCRRWHTKKLRRAPVWVAGRVVEGDQSGRLKGNQRFTGRDRQKLSLVLLKTRALSEQSSRIGVGKFLRSFDANYLKRNLTQLTRQGVVKPLVERTEDLRRELICEWFLVPC